MGLNHLAFAANNPLGGDAAALGTALAHADDSADALAAYKRLLPDTWVQPLVEVAALAGQLRPSLRAQLKYLQGGAEPAGGGGKDRKSGGKKGGKTKKAGAAGQQAAAAALGAVAGAAEAAGAALRPFNNLQGQYRCDGCGTHAVGVRKCSRCRATQYCR